VVATKTARPRETTLDGWRIACRSRDGCLSNSFTPYRRVGCLYGRVRQRESTGVSVARVQEDVGSREPVRLGGCEAEDIPLQTRATALEDIARGLLSPSLKRREQSLCKRNLRRSCDVPGPCGGQPCQVNRTSATGMRAQEHVFRLSGV